jgi:ABC-2 type transport system ATP-binding protein
MSSESIIKVHDVKKAFDGVQAVNGVSFEIPQGHVVGFIGANGAGKTTTMRMMATLEIPDAGTIEINGWDVANRPREVRQSIGWMPDNYGAYEHVSVLDYLDFYARACGFRGVERRRRVEEVMQFADLGPLAERPMNGLSKGMAQRLCFGRALLQDPPILILDEPAAGLDPKARLEFKNLVQLLARKGTTIFISSHILSELGEMCESLLYIDAGRIVHHGTAAMLQERNGSSAFIVDIQVHGSELRLVEWLSMQPGWKLMAQAKGGVRAEYESGDKEQLSLQLRRMIQDGILVTDFHRQERRLEEIFVDVVRESNGSNVLLPILPELARP